MGIMVFGLGLSAIFYALETLKPWNVTMILLLGPVAGAGAAWSILGETINNHQIAGSALVLFALVLSVMTTKDTKTSRKDTESSDEVDTTSETIKAGNLSSRLQYQSK